MSQAAAVVGAEPDLIVRREGAAGSHPAQPAEGDQCHDAGDVCGIDAALDAVRGRSGASL